MARVDVYIQALHTGGRFRKYTLLLEFDGEITDVLENRRRFLSYSLLSPFLTLLYGCQHESGD